MLDGGDDGVEYKAYRGKFIKIEHLPTLHLIFWQGHLDLVRIQRWDCLWKAEGK